MKIHLILFIFIAYSYQLLAQGVTDDTTKYLKGENWDNFSAWGFSYASGSTGSISTYEGLSGDGITLSYSYPSGGGWINTERTLNSYSTDNPIVFFIYSSSNKNDLELKFVDNDGSVYGVKSALSNYYGEWKLLTVYLDNTEYWWGGNSSFDSPVKFSVALSGSIPGSGTVYIDEIGIGKTGLPSTFLPTIDPNAELPGIGFLQRRDESIGGKDPLVLEYLIALQDYSSANDNVIATYKGGAEAQTFNNSLTAMAFISENEQERAERILDFYQNATDSSNTDLKKQNVFYNGEARGFYQQFLISTNRDGGTSDRWIGDMAWLLITCKNYEIKYSSDKYDYLIGLIHDLLKSYFRKAVVGGYVQSGWRHGDSYLHESNGHHEGNIDCYVAFKLCGDEYYAHNIKLWLDNELAEKTSLPLDLYTWRALAFGAISDDYVALLNIPEYDFRFRKIIEVNGSDVMGMYSFPDMEINNFWNDGTAHISCAFQAFGDINRGYFYANQLDPLIKEQSFGTITTHGIPYTLNTEGYPGVDPNVPVISCSAWYIMAKNGINPFLSEEFEDIISSVELNEEITIELSVFPNPFSDHIDIHYSLSHASFVTIAVMDMSGRKILKLDPEYRPAGIQSQSINFSIMNQIPPSGIYFIQLSTENDTYAMKILCISE